MIQLLFSALVSFGQVTIGQTAPDFSLPGNDGKTYKLSDHKGKFVVLEWFNDDCPYVKKHYDAEFMAMQKLQKKWVMDEAKKTGKQLVWLNVVSSAPGKQGHLTAEKASKIKMKRKAHMNAIVMDPTGEVGKAYGAKTTPHMFVIDPEMKVRYNGAIDDQPSANTRSLASAKNYVNDSLMALFAGKAVAAPSTTPYGCSVKYQN